jgi:hypothetical protein
MHALTCQVLKQDTVAYAMIPTYYRPNIFIACKVYIEYVYHAETVIFYHCIVKELLDDEVYLLQYLNTALFRSIDRRTGQVDLRRPIVRNQLSKQALLTDMQIWQKDFVLDIPAPFVCEDAKTFEVIKNDIRTYFTKLSTELNTYSK